MKRLTLAFLLLALLMYLSIGIYFAFEIVAFQTRTLEQDKVYHRFRSFSQLKLPENAKEVFIESSGIKLAGSYFEKSSSDCGIIYNHGYSGTRYHMYKYAYIFEKYNCHEIYLDARHHGKSEGKYGTFGYHEKNDLLNVSTYLQKKAGLKTKRIAFVGVSYGASISLQAVGKSKEMFWFVLADSPYKDMKSILTEQALKRYPIYIQFSAPAAFFFASLFADFRPDEVSAEKLASDIHCPVLIIHSNSDVYTLPYHSKVIFQNLKHPKSKLLLTDWNAVHGKSMQARPEQYKMEVQQFVDSL